IQPTLKPFQPRKGEPTFKQWLAGKRPEAPAPAPLDLETLSPDVAVSGHGPMERLRDEAIKQLGLKHWANPQNFTKANDAAIQTRMVDLARTHPKFRELFVEKGGNFY